MAHQQFPTKAQTQKAENKVLLLPNAEYIIVLLSLPFKFWIAARAILQNTGHIHIAVYSGFTL